MMVFFNSVPLSLLLLMCITNAIENNFNSNMRYFPHKIAWHPVKLINKRSPEEKNSYNRYHNIYFDKIRHSVAGGQTPITRKTREEIHPGFALDTDKISSSDRVTPQYIRTIRTNPEGIRNFTDHPGASSKVNDTNTQLSGTSWEEWTSWSQCSVTCGKGRQIRWRHCVLRECIVADSEMEEKMCNLHPCSSK